MFKHLMIPVAVTITIIIIITIMFKEKVVMGIVIGERGIVHEGRLGISLLLEEEAMRYFHIYHLIKFDPEWLEKTTFSCILIQIFIIAIKTGSF